MASLTYDKISVGDSAEVSKTITEQDINDFAELSGDNNPAHLDEEYAKNTAFKHRIAHGMFVSSLISNVLGNELPGHGTIYMTQSLKFIAPVYINDTITARVEVIKKIAEKKRIVFQTTCTNQDGKIVIDGEALVSPPR